MAAERPKISVTSIAVETLPSEARLGVTLAAELARFGLRVPSASRGGLSPTPGARLQVPSGSGRPVSAGGAADGWCDEVELIHSCALLSRMLGMPKSFSTGDITRLQDELEPVRKSVSQVALIGARPDLTNTRLDQASRSCSTWVACGDLASTSQLPSPQGRQNPAGQSPFSPADLVRAVNKKVRQNYIRRRLQVTFKAVQRLSQSEFSLEQLLNGTLPGAADTSAAATPASSRRDTSTEKPADATHRDAAAPPKRGITVREVDRERGQPLTRYQRNMMVFNWLQTLDVDNAELKVI